MPPPFSRICNPAAVKRGFVITSLSTEQANLGLSKW